MYIKYQQLNMISGNTNFSYSLCYHDKYHKIVFDQIFIPLPTKNPLNSTKERKIGKVQETIFAFKSRLKLTITNGRGGVANAKDSLNLISLLAEK